MQGTNVWSQVGIPYVIDNGGLTVPVGATLTFAPGVVVKFSAPTLLRLRPYLNVLGSLTANGTATQPITFTSYKDDTVLGDTNGDGNHEHQRRGTGLISNLPAARRGSVSYATVRYGGSRYQNTRGTKAAPVEIGALEIATQSAQPTLANLTLTDNITGIRFNGGGTNGSVTASTFLRNTNGVHVVSSASPTISGNTFTDNARQRLRAMQADLAERYLGTP